MCMALLALGCRGLEISLRQYVENGISPSKIVLGARRGHCGHHFHHPVSIGTLPADGSLSQVYLGMVTTIPVMI